MFSNYSWTDYGIVVISVLLIYYGYIFLKYYLPYLNRKDRSPGSPSFKEGLNNNNFEVPEIIIPKAEKSDLKLSNNNNIITSENFSSNNINSELPSITIQSNSEVDSEEDLDLLTDNEKEELSKLDAVLNESPSYSPNEVQNDSNIIDNFEINDDTDFHHLNDIELLEIEELLIESELSSFDQRSDYSLPEIPYMDNDDPEIYQKPDFEEYE